MQDQYFELKEMIGETHDHRVIQSFDDLWKTYENPDQEVNNILDEMYPETVCNFDLEGSA